MHDSAIGAPTPARLYAFVEFAFTARILVLAYRQTYINCHWTTGRQARCGDRSSSPRRRRAFQISSLAGRGFAVESSRLERVDGVPTPQNLPQSDVKSISKIREMTFVAVAGVPRVILVPAIAPVIQPHVNAILQSRSLQFRVLGFGLLQYGDVGVGVFPEGEEILILGL